MNMERGVASQKESEDDIALTERGERYLDHIIAHAREPRMTFEDAEVARKRYAESDKRIRKLSQYEQTFNTILRRYGVRVNVQKIAPDIFRVPVTGDTAFLLNSLPDGYVYIGGAARAVLERTLGTNPNVAPRDIDIAADTFISNGAMKDILEQRYMPEDSSHGYGISPVGDHYFENRDFTRNELIFDGKDIYCTKACLLDTVRSITRLSDSERSKWKEHTPQWDSRLLAKALRFVAIDWQQEFKDADMLEYENIAPFYMALHLDRAYEEGESAAERYLKLLREYRQVPMEVDTLSALQAYLNERLQHPFVFRSIPCDRLKEEDMLDEISKELENLPTHGSTHRYGNAL